MFGNCEERRALCTVPDIQRHEILKNFRVFVPKQSRLCEQHNNSTVWNGIDINNNSTNIFKRNHVEELIALLLNHNKTAPGANESVIENQDMKQMVGLSPDQFDAVYSLLPSIKQYYKGKDKPAKAALKAFLVRMRTGHTYD